VFVVVADDNIIVISYFFSSEWCVFQQEGEPSLGGLPFRWWPAAVVRR